MNTLILYDKAIAAIAECASIDEAKDIADKNSALMYYGKQSNNMELEIYAAEIKLRAVRRMGEICTLFDKNVGANQYQYGQKKSLPNISGEAQYVKNQHVAEGKKEALKSAGISSQQASVAERIAAIPAADMEAYIAEKKDVSKPVSVHEIIKKTSPVKEVNKAIAKHSVPEKEVPEDEEYDPDDDLLKEMADTIQTLAEENKALKDKIAVGALLPEDRNAAKETIESLRESVADLEKEVWRLKNELTVMTTSRDRQMTLNAKMQSLINHMKRQTASAK